MARKSIEEIAAASAGQSSEESPYKNPGGLYEYTRPDGTVVQLIARESERFGTPQADALVRVGYVYVRPATVEELSIPAFIPGPTKQQIAQGFSEPMVPKAQLDAMEARLAALETVPAAPVVEAPAPVEEAPVPEETPVVESVAPKK